MGRAIEDTNPKAISVVFFDIGGTLGDVGPDRRLRPYAGTRQLLDTLRTVLGVRLGIITNVPADMSHDGVSALLEESGLRSAFAADGIVTSNDACTAKPDEAIYRFAAQRVGVTPAECLFVGENRAEVAGAIRAGMSGLIRPSP